MNDIVLFCSNFVILLPAIYFREWWVLLLQILMIGSILLSSHVDLTILTTIDKLTLYTLIPLVIVGCLYNLRNGPPLPLPAAPPRSGGRIIKT